MPVITRATSKVATIVEEEGIEITRTSALIGMLRVITVRGWATGRCTAATIAKGSKMATKMGIEGIKPLESIWIEWSPIARSGYFYWKSSLSLWERVRVRAYGVKNTQILT